MQNRYYRNDKNQSLDYHIKLFFNSLYSNLNTRFVTFRPPCPLWSFILWKIIFIPCDKLVNHRFEGSEFQLLMKCSSWYSLGFCLSMVWSLYTFAWHDLVMDFMDTCLSHVYHKYWYALVFSPGKWFVLCPYVDSFS